jgi:hypothetical protein
MATSDMREVGDEDCFENCDDCVAFGIGMNGRKTRKSCGGLFKMALRKKNSNQRGMRTRGSAGLYSSGTT